MSIQYTLTNAIFQQVLQPFEAEISSVFTLTFQPRKLLKNIKNIMGFATI